MNVSQRPLVVEDITRHHLLGVPDVALRDENVVTSSELISLYNVVESRIRDVHGSGRAVRLVFVPELTYYHWCGQKELDPSSLRAFEESGAVLSGTVLDCPGTLGNVLRARWLSSLVMQRINLLAKERGLDYVAGILATSNDVVGLLERRCEGYNEVVVQLDENPWSSLDATLRTYLGVPQGHHAEVSTHFLSDGRGTLTFGTQAGSMLFASALSLGVFGGGRLLVRGMGDDYRDVSTPTMSGLALSETALAPLNESETTLLHYELGGTWSHDTTFFSL